MNVIVDHDYWFEGDPADAEVTTPDGEKGMLLERADREQLQWIRDVLDKGELPGNQLVTRNPEFLRSKWPSIAVRIQFTDARKVSEEYPKYSRAIAAVSASVRFTDVRRVDGLFSEPDGVPTEIKSEALQLTVQDRENTQPIPSPSLLDSYPDLVASLLRDEAVSRVGLVSRLIDDPRFQKGLENPDDVDEAAVCEWVESLGWLSGSELTDLGDFVREYVIADEETKHEYETAAVLIAAESSVSQLVASKLDDALADVSVTIPEAVQSTETFEIIQHRSDTEIYEQARSSVGADRLSQFLSNVDIDDAETFREYVAESKARELDGITDDLDFVPVELYASEVPEELEPLVAGLNPDVLESKLDNAIADDRATLNDALSALEEIIDQLRPILSPRHRERLSELMGRVTETRDGLAVKTPESPQECLELYETLVNQELSKDFSFARTAERFRENILERCEEYIRDSYPDWIDVGDRADREVNLLVDAPDIVEERFASYDHVVMLISDGFGLRQWLEGSKQVPRYQDWKEAGAVDNELTTTVFPSETGAGHYSFLTGQFPLENGRDNIKKSISIPDDHLFSRANSRGAHTKALSYLSGEGFSSVLSTLADEFEELSDFRSASSALSGKSLQAVASHVQAYKQTFTVIQHNQIDQIHESGDHIADALLPGVTSNLLDYIESLSTTLDENVCVVVTADHGMLRLDDELLDVTSGEMQNELKNRGFRTDTLGQRIVGLKQVSGGARAWGEHNRDRYEILKELDMEDLNAKTNDKCDGPVLRMKRRYYSHHEQLSATHGGFTFDEMFIPMLTFDLQTLAEISS